MRFVIEMYNEKNELVDSSEHFGHYAMVGVSVVDKTNNVVATRTQTFNNPLAMDLIRTNLSMTSTVADRTALERVGTSNSVDIYNIAGEIFEKFKAGHIDTCGTRYDECWGCGCCVASEE